ncbi:MAG TPA: alpha/beta hydrolase [Burkholderiales bacterium]|jgi:pimeloyl-ACP methyl ester carboxylesterase
MPYLDLGNNFKMFYKIDDWTNAWDRPETIVLVHGFTETTEAWHGWIPHLARKYRVIRMDLRGFGQSGPVPADFTYTNELFVDDLVRVINLVAGEPVHVIGAKSGGISLVTLTAKRPDLVKSLTMVCTPVLPTDGTGWIERMEKNGLRDWARHTMRGRMGSAMPERGIDWWVELMGATALSTAHAYLRWVGTVDIRPELPQLTRPTLVIANDTPRRPRAYFEEYQKQIPNSVLEMIPVDGYHPGGTDPDACAQATLKFLANLPKAA